MEKKYLILLVLLLFLISCDLLNDSERDYSGRDVETDIFKMEYLGYTDYYNGDCIALKYDFTNKTDKIINHIRWTVNLTYEGGSSQTMYPDIYQTIGPNTTSYSMWVPVACGMVWYSSHAIEEVHIWYSDGTDYIWQY